jgi:hypothetical protein
MQESLNPFIDIYRNELKKKKYPQQDRWDFYQVSSEGVKLNCKFLKSLIYRNRNGEWEMMQNIAIVKDIAIDDERMKKGYASQFIKFLIQEYDVIHLESVQPTWLIERLESQGTLWIKQSISGCCYILLKSDIDQNIGSTIL